MRRPNQIYVRKINGKKFRVQTLSCSENWSTVNNICDSSEEYIVLGEVPKYYYLDGGVCKPHNRGYCRLPTKTILKRITSGELKLGDDVITNDKEYSDSCWKVSEILREADGKKEKIWALFNEVPF